MRIVASAARLLCGVMFALTLATVCLAAPEAPTVHEITMAAPDIIRIEVREAPIRRGFIVRLPSPSGGAHGSWIKLATGEQAKVIGRKRDHARIADTADILPLDRASVDQPAGYGPIGSKRVVAVYRKSEPWSSGTIGSGAAVASFRHYIYLKLDGQLPNGEYRVQWPKNLLRPTNFAFDDKATRSSSIRASQLGHRADDVSKYAYLVLWLPGGPENGAVDFRRYDLRRFHIINERGESVFAGDIDLRLGPRDTETGHGAQGALKTYTLPDGSTYDANRAGTYVFGLDYSSWHNARSGTYRIAIAGLGTSDTFVIDDAIWYRAASTSMEGLYHQRSGIALDGRFGYTRPECFTAKSGITVLESRLPLAFSKEGDGFVDFTHAAKPPWITDQILHDVEGGYHDAGDWDRRIQHVLASYLLLDVYLMLPEVSRDLKFGTPASGAVLRHPSYRGKDFPDLVDEAIWNLDFFRRLQRRDGAVRGGVESSASPTPLEPCWLESLAVFAYAPDPWATFIYAAGAAKLAIVLLELGEPELAQLYRESALRAWDWAARALTNPDGAFGEAQQLLGLPPADYAKRLSPIIQRTKDAQLWAAATLFRLTGEDVFNNVALERLRGWIDVTAIMPANGAWEYANANQAKADAAVQNNARRTIVDVARRFIVQPQHRQAAYRTMQWGGSPLMWGQGLAPTLLEASLLTRSHYLSNAMEFLASMLDGSAHILGANQIGMSFTTGIGQRPPLAPLHVDSINAGVPTPRGITIYGWTTPAMTSGYTWIWGPAWAALSDQVPTKRIEPARRSLPFYEFIIQYPWIIVSAEYTVHQTIATTAAVWAYLHAHQRRKSAGR